MHLISIVFVLKFAANATSETRILFVFWHTKRLTVVFLFVCCCLLSYSERENETESATETETERERVQSAPPEANQTRRKPTAD